jgi:hypothetical protein
LANPINWNVVLLDKYGDWACHVDFHSPPEQCAGIFQDDLITRLINCDLADPADRPGCYH